MQKEVSLSRSKLLIESDDASSRDSMVLFLPGISGQAFSERFQPLVDATLQRTLPIARVRAWENSDDVEAKTWTYYHGAITEVIDHLRGLGYQKIIAVGKSFGGALLLSYHNASIIKKILWAPAIGVGTDTLSELAGTTLSEVAELLDIQINSDFIHDDPSEICIIHGSADPVIPLQNSERVVEAAQNGQLVAIDGADHSFKTPEHEKALMNATRAALSE